MPNFGAQVIRFPDVKALKQTPRALLVEIDGKQHWVPQSQIDDESEVFNAEGDGELIVSEWWATREGLV